MEKEYNEVKEGEEKIKRWVPDGNASMIEGDSGFIDEEDVYDLVNRAQKREVLLLNLIDKILLTIILKDKENKFDREKIKETVRQIYELYSNKEKEICDEALMYELRK